VRRPELIGGGSGQFRSGGSRCRSALDFRRGCIGGSVLGDSLGFDALRFGALGSLVGAPLRFDSLGIAPL
jgi:hypothetical protein